MAMESELTKKIATLEENKDVAGLEEVKNDAEAIFDGETAGLAEKAIVRLTNKVEEITPPVETTEGQKNQVENMGGSESGLQEVTAPVDEKIAEKDRSIRTMFGRVRRLPYVNNPKQHFGALRQAVNTVVQGSAADIIKLAMIKLDAEFAKTNDANILLQVHDELVCEARLDVINERFHTMINIMENIVELIVPLEADGKICDNWSQMKNDDFISYHVEPKKYFSNDFPIYVL